jgi:hypothetical protein
MTSVADIADNTSVNLFGTDIPNAGVSAKIEKARLRIGLQLLPDIDADASKSGLYLPGSKMKGMGANGPNRFWF